jgi:hypothetical protein
MLKNSNNPFVKHHRKGFKLPRLSYAQYMDIKTYLPDDILYKVDIASMANSLETRTPLIDIKIAKLAAELPNQFINAGVNEQAMMGMAAGIASTGKRVFVYSIGNFPTLRCLEQIRNDICLMNNPVVVVSVGAGYAYGPQGYTHHALEDIAVIRALPNIQVVIPADPIEAKLVTKFLRDIGFKINPRIVKQLLTCIHISVHFTSWNAEAFECWGCGFSAPRRAGGMMAGCVGLT